MIFTLPRLAVDLRHVVNNYSLHRDEPGGGTPKCARPM